MSEPSYLSRNNSLSTILGAILAACITFMVYLPALQNGFVNWDDDEYVYANPHIKSVDIDFVKWSFTSPMVGHWLPLTWVSFALDHAVWGLNPLGYHLTNIFLHSLNTLLLFILVIILFQVSHPEMNRLGKKELIGGLVTSLLFGIHPLHVESVAWVTERKDVLSLSFFLASIISYVKYSTAEGSKKPIYYISCLILFSMGLMTKSMILSLPIVLLILDYFPLTRLRIKGGFRKIKPILVEKLPFLALSILSAKIAIWAASSKGALEAFDKFPLTARIVSACRGYTFYLLKMILPLNLAPLYPYPESLNLFNVEYIGSFILLLLITLICLILLKRTKLFAAVWLYFIITLIPVIGLIQAGPQSTADRYTYLPSLGPFLLAGLGVGTLFEKTLKRKIYLASGAILVIMAVILTGKTLNQISIWHDSISLWSHEIRFFPDLDLPYDNRGNAYAISGAYQKAIEDYNRSIDLNPGYAGTYTNRGNVYLSVGNYLEALRDYSMAIKLEPENAASYRNRGDIYNKAGNYQEAIRDFEMAIRLNPQYGEAYYSLGTVYSRIGKVDQARICFVKAASLGSRRPY